MGRGWFGQCTHTELGARSATNTVTFKIAHLPPVTTLSVDGVAWQQRVQPAYVDVLIKWVRLLTRP